MVVACLLAARSKASNARACRPAVGLEHPCQWRQASRSPEVDSWEFQLTLPRARVAGLPRRELLHEVAGRRFLQLNVLLRSLIGCDLTAGNVFAIQQLTLECIAHVYRPKP